MLHFTTDKLSGGCGDIGDELVMVTNWLQQVLLVVVIWGDTGYRDMDVVPVWRD